MIDFSVCPLCFSLRGGLQQFHGVALTKDLQTYWLKTKQKFILSQFWRPEVENPPQPWGLQERICSLRLLASGGSRHSLACGLISPVSAPMGPCSFFSLCVLLQGHLSLDVGTSRTNQDHLSHLNILNLIASAKTFSKAKIIFSGSGDQGMDISFGGYNSTHSRES